MRERLKGLEDEESKAEAEIERAQERKGDVREQRRRIEKAIKVLRGEPLSKPKASKTRSNGSPPAEEMVENVKVAAIRLAKSNGDGFFLNQLQEVSPHSPETTSRCLDVLRSQHVVRRAGKRPNPKGRGRNMHWYELDLEADR